MPHIQTNSSGRPPRIVRGNDSVNFGGAVQVLHGRLGKGCLRIPAVGEGILAADRFLCIPESIPGELAISLQHASLLVRDSLSLKSRSHQRSLDIGSNVNNDFTEFHVLLHGDIALLTTSVTVGLLID